MQRILYLAIRTALSLLLFVASFANAGAREYVPAPLYQPGPGAALTNLVQWKISWMKASIKARTSAIHGKELALQQNPGDTTLQHDINDLKADNTREEDEVTALQAPTAFDPKVPGTNQNVKLLRDNVLSARDTQHAIAVAEIQRSRNEKLSKAEREAAAEKSKQYANSETKLDHDLTSANEGPLKPFKP